MTLPGSEESYEGLTDGSGILHDYNDPKHNPPAEVIPASEETVPATDAGITDEAVRKACKRIYGDTWSLLEAIKLRDLINDTISTTREQAVRECAEKWQSIETAPRDGTHFIGWDENTGAVETYWYVHPVVQAWVAVEIDCNDYEFEPTLWVPKPLSLIDRSAKA